MAETTLLDLVTGATESTKITNVNSLFTEMSYQKAISIACQCIEKVLPKEEKLYWQALVLRDAAGGERATTDVLNGQEIQSLLDEKTSADDNTT